MLLVLDRQAIHESPQIDIDNQFLQIVRMGETQTTNQRQCSHGRWPEVNVGQQYQK